MNSPKNLYVVNRIFAHIRKYLALKRFRKSRNLQQKNRKKEIEDLKEIYDSPNLIKAENRRQVQYSQNDWMHFYPNDEKKFVKKYKNTLIVEILVVNKQEIYTGSINYNNQKHGFGVSILKNGSKYTGFWEKNSFEGWGEFIDTDGNIFHGLFKKGKLNGKGKKFSINGNYYEGDFKDGLRCGCGKEETKDHIYEGQFENDKKNKKGKLIYKNIKDIYEGDFVDNNITGIGKYQWENKDIFEGDFINGKMHGRGKYKWPDGGEYDGEYINNIKEGKGVFKWANGKIYEGPFLGGKPHGVGILKNNGKSYEVEFFEGKMKKKPSKNDFEPTIKEDKQ